MNFRGAFELERDAVAVGEPVAVVLTLRNEGDRDVFVFLPHGRANGIDVRVVEGEAFRMTGLEREPEAGLVGETRLSPGATHRHVLPLSDWLTFERPGRFVLECAITLEVFDGSLRDGGPRNSELLQVAGTLELHVRERAEASG